LALAGDPVAFTIISSSLDPKRKFGKDFRKPKVSMEIRKPISRPADLTRGYTIAVTSAFVLSTTAIFIRHLTQSYQLPALVLAFWREIMVALVLFGILRMAKPELLRVDKRSLPYLIFYGFVLAIYNSLWTLSVALNGAAVSTVLVYSSAAFTALLGRWLLHERLTWPKIAAIFLSLGGCILVANALEPTSWRGNLIGILTGVLSGLCYAIYSLMGRSAAQRGLNSWTTLLYIFGFASVFMLCTNLLPWKIVPGMAMRPVDLFWLGRSLSGWLILFLLAAGPTVFGYGLYNLSLVYLPSSTANLIVTMEPPITAGIAYLLLGERMTALQIVGGLLILAGVVLLRIFEGRAGAGESSETFPAETKIMESL
jgi:drug/metabolite transporter (DMT)-like permease